MASSFVHPPKSKKVQKAGNTTICCWL